MESLEENQQRHYKLSTILLIIGVSWGSASYGYTANIIGTTLGQPSFLHYMGLDTASNASQLIGAMNALFFVGGFFGTLLVGTLANRFGRRPVIGLGVFIILIATALQAGSVNIGMFIVFRFFSGMGGFMTLTSVPLWITETVPPRSRGVLSDINPILINIGYVGSSWVGVGFYFYHGHGNEWRAPIALGCLPCIICLASLWWVPESPRYLLIKDEPTKAWEIVRNLHGRDGSDTYPEREFELMLRQIQFDRSLKSTYLEMFRRPSYRKRCVMAIGLIFILVSSGVLVINNYGTILYAQLGYDTVQQLVLQAGWLMVSTTANVLALLVVDRMARNVLMGIGLTGCLVSLSIFTALLATYNGTDHRSGLATAVAMIYVYPLSYGGFLDGVTWWYAAEIFPTHLRAQGMTIAMATYCVSNIIWLQAAPTAFKTIQWKFYLFFIIITAIGTVIVYLTFPDTLNKPLEEVARLFGDQDLVVDSGLNLDTIEKDKNATEVEEVCVAA